MLGAAKLSGLSKKDQKARERERLGLAPQKDHKRPYKELVALRKKQREQDAAAAALAKQAGMTVRKQAAELAGNAGSAADFAKKVLVQFETVEAAMACARELHGKQFDSRTVTAAFVPELTLAALLEQACYSA